MKNFDWFCREIYIIIIILIFWFVYFRESNFCEKYYKYMKDSMKQNKYIMFNPLSPPVIPNLLEVSIVFFFLKKNDEKWWYWISYGYQIDLLLHTLVKYSAVNFHTSIWYPPALCLKKNQHFLVWVCVCVREGKVFHFFCFPT